MNKVLISGFLNGKPKPLGQNNKAAIMYVEGGVMKWDPTNREMFQETVTFEVVCFGNSLQKLRDQYSVGTYVTVEGHLDVRENESNGNIYRNSQIIADEINFVGDIEDGGGHGPSTSDNMDPPVDSWGTSSRGRNTPQGGGPDDDIPF